MALTAPDHAAVVTWAYALTVQVHRLRQSRRAAIAADDAAWSRRQRGPRDNEPWHLIRAETHFALTAAMQLFRALTRFDGDLRLPATVRELDVKTLRHALEHWDDADGPAQRAVAALGIDPRSHEWRSSGAGTIGELVDDEALLQWAEAVYDELVDFDPPSPWAQGQGEGGA